MNLLDGKVAVVTGGSRGLGLAIDRAYGREGAAVVIGSRSAGAVERAVGELKAAGGKAAGMACDVSDAGQVEQLAGMAQEAFGGLDIWVNSAGIAGPYGPTLAIE